MAGLLRRLHHPDVRLFRRRSTPARRPISANRLRWRKSINEAFKALGLFQPDSNAKSTVVSTDKAAHPREHRPGRRALCAATAAVKADFERMHRELQARLSTRLPSTSSLCVLAARAWSFRCARLASTIAAQPSPSRIHGRIDTIVSALRPTPYDIRIEGHTDNVPIHTGEFASNWELSTSRATHMARLFIEHFQFEPRRLAAAGYAEYHPVASNESAEGRGQNRRVDIIVLPSINGVPQMTLVPSVDADSSPNSTHVTPSQSAAKGTPAPPTRYLLLAKWILGEGFLPVS